MSEPKYIGDHARLTPDKPAVIHGPSGAQITYRELDERSMRLAQWLHQQGLRRGDHFALLMENHLRYFEICWAAYRSGLVVTPVNRFLTPDEARYIVRDSGSKVLISSHAMRELATAIVAPATSDQALSDDSRPPPLLARLMVDGTIDGWQSYEATLAASAAEPLHPQWMGSAMLYSSGTTGRPKGIIRAQPQGLVSDGPARRELLNAFRFSADTVYLSPAPLYHAAPLGYTMSVQFLGGTVIFMDKFDAAQALSLIERYRVTHSQWVPTMFVRMLKLPDAERKAFDLSSHQVAIHAAAPCPVEVKRQMIDWWGPMLYEYYAGTESNGATVITSPDWLLHPGSVGRSLVGELHICDDEGVELPIGETGLIYFARDEVPFSYHNDPDKTRSAQHPKHPNWTALGDIGRVDEEGYLYLTDRKSFMIISGGVNIYPQMVEDALTLHPKVGDVAVIGVPNAEMGEEVKAVVEPAPGVAPSEALAEELLAFVKTRVARYMVPRSIDFIDTLPRLPTGKLLKRSLRDRYWPG